MSERSLIVTPDEFPHGLRCANCNRIIENGEPYAHIEEAPIGGYPVMLIVGPECAGATPNFDPAPEMTQAMRDAATTYEMEP